MALALVVPLGLALFPATTDLIGLPPDWPSWAGLLAGSLLPDIDGGGTIARPSKFLPDIIPRWADRVLDRIGLTISRVIRALFGHRGALHWPLWGGLLIFVAWKLGLVWMTWLGIGYLLHLAGDVITVQGVPLLGPLLKKKFKLLPLRVGGAMESILGSLLWTGVAIGLAWLYLPGQYALARETVAAVWEQVAYRLTLK